MAELKGSKTEKNLETAFAGESMARNKYTYFASKQEKTGMYRLPIFLKRPQIMRRNMLKCGSS